MLFFSKPLFGGRAGWREPRRGGARPWRLGWLALLAVVLTSRGAGAQSPATGIALSGEPFGVARIRLPLTLADAIEPGLPVEITEADGRTFYPVTRELQVTRRERLRQPPPQPGPIIGGGRLLSRVGEAIRSATAPESQQTIGREMIVLFRGDQPLRIQLRGDVRHELTLTPVPATPLEHGAAMSQWWNAFAEATRQQSAAGDYPPVVEEYLTAMLGSRLRLPAPPSAPASEETGTIASTLELIAGSERLRTEILRRVARGETERLRAADQPLPREPAWMATEVPPAEGETEIEPLAQRVPSDCFYLRFGSFRNYLWFRDLSNRYGGDVTRMVTLRGFDYAATERVESQLQLKTTELARMLGDEVVEDMAIIGRDLFLTEGASIGVLLSAKNAFVLGTSLRSDRNAVLRRLPEAQLREVEIRGQQVSFLSTSDNTVRSFLVQDGSRFFITNSRHLADEFLGVAAGELPSLAQTPEYRYARQLMPVAENHTLFAYFSSGFLRGLISPQYQIELRRRLYATADTSLVHLARMAARGEGRSIDQVDELVGGGFLPIGFGQRPDGSGPIVAGDDVLDARRGRRGSFLPIADVQIEGVTEEEAAWYAGRADYYSRNWQQMDPILTGLRRVDVAGQPDRERLEIHAEVAPFVPDKYGPIARQLGPPTTVAIRFAPDDIAAAQAHVVSDQLRGSIPPHHLFAAIKDTTPPRPDELDGFLRTFFALRGIPGYVGAWPQPGLIDRLPLGVGRGTPVGPGMSRLIGGIYRFQGGGFSVVSFMPDVLGATIPYLEAGEAVDAAQVRLRVDNLQGSQLERWVNQLLYERSYQTSLAGARLLGSLSRQLKVDPDQADVAIEQILGARLQCPLGGEYVLSDRRGPTQWVSTAWEEQRVPGEAPPDYRAPLLTWFRGARARLTQLEDRLVVDATLDMMRGGGPVDPGAQPLLPEGAPAPQGQGRPEQLPIPPRRGSL